jgi:hypothetical protein
MGTGMGTSVNITQSMGGAWGHKKGYEPENKLFFEN